MRRHPIDPVSIALGLIAVGAGVLVTLGEAVDIDADAPWWIAVAGIVIGLAIIPWRRRPPGVAPAQEV